MGYVYKFIHRETKKYYIGSHNKPSLGSNYTGSGLLWKRAIKKHGIDAFIKEILYEGPSYREMEEKILIELDAANDPLSYNMKNQALGGSFFGAENGMYGRKLTEAEKYKCGSGFRGKKRPDHAINVSGARNPMYGKNDHTFGLKEYTDFCAGKTLEEIHGVEKAKIISHKLHEANYGKKKPHLSEKYKGDGNPFFGKTHSEKTKQKLSNQWNSEKRREIHAIAMKKAGQKRRGKIPAQLFVNDKCNYCCFSGTKSNITRWHNENCKLNPTNSKNEIGLFSYIECPHCGFRCNTIVHNSRRNFTRNHVDNCKILKTCKD